MSVFLTGSRPTATTVVSIWTASSLLLCCHHLQGATFMKIGTVFVSFSTVYCNFLSLSPYHYHQNFLERNIGKEINGNFPNVEERNWCWRKNILLQKSGAAQCTAVITWNQFWELPKEVFIESSQDQFCEQLWETISSWKENFEWKSLQMAPFRP